MRNWKWAIVLVLLLSLALSLAACGGDSEDTSTEPQPPASVSETEPTVAPTDTEAPTDTPVPTLPPAPTNTPEVATAPEDLELDIGDLSTPSNLSSYRSNMRMNISGSSGGEAVDASLGFLIEYTSEPLAQHIAISAEGMDEAEAMGSIEMYRVADTAYMKLGEQWLSVPAADAGLDDVGMIEPADMLEDTCGWKKQADTDYNGIPVHHWTMSQEDIEDCMTAESLAEIGEITEASGDLYVAIEGNYIAYMSLIFEGAELQFDLATAEEALDEGRMELTFEMTDVNVPITIEVPEEALTSSATPEDIPIPEDAEEVSSMFGMINFQSASTPQEIADYYKAQMPANGWTEASAEEFSGMFMLEYNKDGRTASLMITTDDETGNTSVVITVEEPES